MPASPSGKVRIAVYSGDKKLKDSVELSSIEIRKEINKISSAHLVILDHCVQEQDFPVSNSDFFKPGKEIKIELGYCDTLETVFKGIVTRHAVKADEDTSELKIDCRDKAISMTAVRKNANYTEKKDSDIISSLINDAGLTPDVEDSAVSHPALVQYDATDWDFMLTRAESAGMLVTVDDAKVTVKAPNMDASPKLKVVNGDDLINFQAEMDAESQLASFIITSWDPKTQKIIEQKVGGKEFNQQGDLNSSALSKAIASPVFIQTCGAPYPPEALKKLIESKRLRTGLARIRGRMTFQGNAQAHPGGLIEVAGTGDHFNGKVFVGGVHHTVKNGNWITETKLGISPEPFSARPDLTSPRAGGILPGISGLQIGVVVKLDGDPLKLHRIQVKVPVLQAETEGIWARLASCYASNSFGSFVLPEVDDEVVLGYFNNDPSHPVIIGSLYNGQHPPPYKIEKKNNIKAFVSREKLTVELDEEKKVITVKTPGKNTIVISDEDKGILLKDQNDNTIKLNDSGISIESPKDIKITAKGKIDIKSTGALSLTSSADLKGEGMNVSLKGKTSLTADGGPNATLKASAMTTIKGGIVKIN
ncbi:MAG: type VI secretion system tip protein VgrG [Candidatus Electrothrix aestuarii]|uniref:Type VI secretion system tip protein VgrG n=1 Tax=Candidatus Electrothrix aestuarii TaxID=3062594 RepID=A0AAU8LV49_9BACT|nr:type VI secretion system tip protein VgrG [Candidatus Electrothrix aestuarii]